MSKYEPLWKWIKDNYVEGEYYITFDTIEEVLGFPIDRSFLNSKKELLEYGFEIKKISLKEKRILTL